MTAENKASFPLWEAIMLVVAVANACLTQVTGLRVASILWAMAAACKVMELAGLPSKSDKNIWLLVWAASAVAGCIATMIGSIVR